ncbi:MAG: c-type cytochrome biogenesis protein CcmI [Tahibacter sp.]
MNFPFVLLVAAMLALALAFVVLPLLRHGRGSSPDRVNAAKLRALDQALAAGVITVDEHAGKRTQIVAEPSAAAPLPAARSRGVFGATVAIALLLPLLAIGMYRWVGEPRALDPEALTAPSSAASPEGHGPDMQKAVDGLIAKLTQNPDDVEGWMLLGRAYKSTERFADAREALKHAFDRAPDNPDVQVEYAEALALASDNRRIDGQALELLQKAYKTDPQQQRALWLLGIADYQAEHYPDAIAHWETLRGMMPADSAATESIQKQIDEARSRAGMPADPHAAATENAGVDQRANGASAGNGSATSSTGGAADSTNPASNNSDATGTAQVKLTIKVSLDPKLAAQASPDALVFVFAKAAAGPPMPLAVQRLKVSDLPATVILDDTKGMMPSLKLSQFPQIIVGARISASGNAIAQSGDLQIVSKPMDVKTTQIIELKIDQVVP